LEAVAFFLCPNISLLLLLFYVSHYAQKLSLSHFPSLPLIICFSSLFLCLFLYLFLYLPVSQFVSLSVFILPSFSVSLSIFSLFPCSSLSLSLFVSLSPSLLLCFTVSFFLSNSFSSFSLYFPSPSPPPSLPFFSISFHIFLIHKRRNFHLLINFLIIRDSFK